jgi:ubiquinone/menaquinone biosynthesis C-methylase UbiE
MTMTAPAKNYWPDDKCAKAFWSQQEVKPYRRLLRDTLDWAAPAAGETWLDLGCGGGPLTQGLWQRSGGTISVVGIDCAAVNEQAYARLGETLTPAPGDRVRFVCHDFSSGLAPLADASFDHAVSGLSISYAEHLDAETGRWSSAAYDRVLAEVFRVLRPSGRFVFSVNVPEPAWWKVGVLSLGDIFHAGHPLRFLKRSLRMMKYGKWLKREARTGRFHYLPADALTAKLAAVGFERITHRISYAGQAYVFRCHKS